MTEELRIWTNGYSNEELVGYEIVCWPECQMLMEIDGFREHSFLINDLYGISKYGSSAYVVEQEFLNQ